MVKIIWTIATLKPVFNDGLWDLISNASLNSNSFQLFALSRTIVLQQ